MVLSILRTTPPPAGATWARAGASTPVATRPMALQMAQARNPRREAMAVVFPVSLVVRNPRSAVGGPTSGRRHRIDVPSDGQGGLVFPRQEEQEASHARRCPETSAENHAQAADG